MNGIIIFYSHSGHTRKIVNLIKNNLHIESLEVVPCSPYNGFFSTYKRAIKERKNNVISKVKNDPIDISKYKYIFIAFPIWFNLPPTFFTTYLKSLNIKNKIIIPITTSIISKETKSFEFLKKELENSQIKLMYRKGLFSRQNINQWLMEVKGMEYGI